MRIFVCFFLLCYCGIAQQTTTVDFLRCEAIIQPNSTDNSLKGVVKYTFKILQNIDSIYLDAINMRIVDTALEGVQVSTTNSKLWLVDSFEKDREYSVFFEYESTPIQTVYFKGDQIWTQGQGKYTSHWLPSIDDMNDKIEFDLTFEVSENETVISNGKLIDVSHHTNSSYWKWDMESPMSSYLVAFVIGNFESVTIHSNSGIPIELYYLTEDKDRVEPTYRYTKELFDFLENEIGVPYPWQNYKQVPVRDFLYAGMENTTITLFSEAFVVDSIGFNDRNYVNVNAHELAHQWFGNYVTETEGANHWLHEGFATYYALLVEKEIFGDDYYYWKLMNSAEQLKSLSDEGKGESLLDPRASSLTFYEKGAWALHVLKELIGKNSFDTAIRNYLITNAFSNVTISNFLDEVRACSTVEIDRWEEDWLNQIDFKSDQAFNSLMQSPFLKKYVELSTLRTTPINDKVVQLKTELTIPDDFIAQEAIIQLSNESIDKTMELYQIGFNSNNLFVRQSIAMTLVTIPKDLQGEYESLLDDKSYVTQEAALYGLWANFPEKRIIYLEKMDGVVGFQDKNIRQLWLVLAYLTKEYREQDTLKFLEELKEYTSPIFSFEIRERAINYLYELQLIDEFVLKNIISASLHTTWRFKKYARGILRELLTNEYYKRMCLELQSSLTEDEINYLNSIIEPKE